MRWDGQRGCARCLRSRWDAGAQAQERPRPATLDAALRNRISHGIRVPDDDEATPPGVVDEAVPPGVLIEDGLSPEDAVALALWNNPGFQVALTDLGLAEPT